MSRSTKTYSAEEKRRAIEQYQEKIIYSARYRDTEWEYRHVILPKPLAKFVPPGICSEDVWRGMGIRQSPGWEMYMRHEPHILLFRRPINYDMMHPPLASTVARGNYVAAKN